MQHLDKIKSAVRKVKGVLLVGLEPYQIGKYYFENPTFCVEQKAKKRAEICKDCRFFVDEPIDFLRTKDKEIPILSGKMCNYCEGCVLSYKTRQDKEICKKWQKPKQI